MCVCVFVCVCVCVFVCSLYNITVHFVLYAPHIALCIYIILSPSLYIYRMKLTKPFVNI